MPMYNIGKASGSPWQHHKEDPNDNITDFQSFKFKARITGRTSAAGDTKDVEIVVSLRYLINFWNTLEMSLIKCKVSIQITLSACFVIIDSADVGKFAITETKVYVPLVTISTPDNTKLLEKFKSGFKRTINRNKY